MKKNLKLFDKHLAGFQYTVGYIHNMLQKIQPERIKIERSKPSFKTTGLLYTCKFYYKNNFYEFYFQNEQHFPLDYTDLAEEYSIRDKAHMLYCARQVAWGQFILYFNFERVLNTKYFKFQKLKDESDLYALHDNKERHKDKYWGEMRFGIYFDPPGHKDEENSLWFTKVSDKVSPLIWISDLMECEDYLRNIYQGNNNDEDSSNGQIENISDEEDAVALIKKLAKKLLLP